MPNIIVIGASAGGLAPLKSIIQPLPADLPAALFIVMHLSPLAPSVLPEILARATSMNVIGANDGDEIKPGTVYVGRPDRHLLIEPGRIRLTRGPKENRHRPAIDVLFRTAARAYGHRVAGIVLTGLMGDGAAGLHVIKSEGGIALVQDPQEARFSMMPQSAIRTGVVDLILPSSEMPAKIIELAQEPWRDVEPKRAKAVAHERSSPEGEKMSEDEDERRAGKPSQFTCPDCSGTLWEFQDGDVVRFRCRVGHAYSDDGVRAGYAESVESALWTAVRSLKESAALEERLADLATQRGDRLSADNFKEVARDRQKQASILRETLLSKNKTDEIVAP